MSVGTNNLNIGRGTIRALVILHVQENKQRLLQTEWRVNQDFTVGTPLCGAVRIEASLDICIEYSCLE